MALNALLHIQTVFQNGITILKRSFCTPPFKIADVREDKKQPQLDLMLMSASPGMLEGDVYKLSIEIEEDCALQLSTQSYQRLYAMKEGAVQEMSVQMGRGASLIYLPHPCVPHAAANYKAQNKIYLSGNCSLLWGEIVCCGRKMNGELFRFSRYHTITEIFKNGRLVVKENLLLQPGSMAVTGMGFMEGFTHQSSLLYLSDNIDLKTIATTLDEYLSSLDGTEHGITALPVQGLLVRVMGCSAEQLFDAARQCAAIIQSLTVKNPLYAG